MHEYSVVAELIDALVPQVQAINGKILCVHLKKGELRILSDRALIQAFELLAEGTRLEGARLEIESIAVGVACSACGYRGPVERVSDEGFHFSVPILSCPSCGAEVNVLAGRELTVERVTVKEESPPEAT